MRIGATYGEGTACAFSVWAPFANAVTLELAGREQGLPMQRDDRGYWHAEPGDVEPGTLYRFRPAGSPGPLPDPASRHQPGGVHGASAVVDHRTFRWTDADWRGLALREYVIYEVHVGTFTEEGTFAAIRPRLGDLRELGITALEIMPVAQFPGSRNWGYDGVCPFAVQHSYGGPDGLKELVDACHGHGLAVILDVVYNHLGPEGNSLGRFGPYFTEKYRTPWGPAVNVDDACSDEVRLYFRENMLMWLRDYHCDALRLDAVHAIYDFSAQPFLAGLAAAAHEVGRATGIPRHLIAESDLSDARIIRSPALGGAGLDAQWLDDLHHALLSLATGERNGYYRDFGSVDDVVHAYAEGNVYAGRYSAFRKRHHGNSSADCPPARFVVFTQNHDQVGNRMMGDRPSTRLSFEELKLLAAACLLSPYLPMLFMGEEYAEEAPFCYFVSHSDPALIEAVRKGRKAEFAAFARQGEAPDPQSEETFERSRLRWARRESGRHAVMLRYYRRLLRLRKGSPWLRDCERSAMDAGGRQEDRLVWLVRGHGPGRTALVLNFGDEPLPMMLDAAGASWRLLLDSADREWEGPGATVHGALAGGEEFIAGPHRAIILEQTT